jgi:hypothetical protein
MSRPPQEVVELLGVGGVTHGNLRKLSLGCNRIVTDVRQQGRLASLCNLSLERV